MFRLMTMNSSATEHCFIDFLEAIMATYGDTDIPAFNLNALDRLEHMDRRRLCVHITSDSILLLRPCGDDSYAYRMIQALKLPQLLSKRATRVGLCGDLLELMRCLYEGYGAIERQGYLPTNDTSAQITCEPIGLAYMKNHLNHLLGEVRVHRAQALRLVFKENGMVALYLHHNDQTPPHRPCLGRWYFRYVE